MVLARKLSSITVALLLAFCLINVYASGISVSKTETKTKIKTPIAPQQKKPPVTLPVHRQIYHRSVAHFNGIEADGNFDIHITNSPGYRVKITDRNLNCVQAWVDKQGLLVIDLDDHLKICRGNQGTVNVLMPELAALYLSGTTAVMATHVHSNYLIIEAKGNSSAMVRGTVNVGKISTADNSDVSVRWVNSSNLQVHQHGSSEVHLAGVTALLQARLFDQSYLDSKFLRAETILVHANDQATANILATRFLYAFADDQSNIYYFKSPEHQVQATQISGNVLQLAHWR